MNRIVHTTNTVIANQRRTGKAGINRVASAPGPWLKVDEDFTFTMDDFNLGDAS